MAQRGGAFRGAIFDVDGVLVDSPHKLAWRQAFMAFPDALRFVLDVKAAGHPGRGGVVVEERQAVPGADPPGPFAAEQRIDYEFVHAGHDARGLSTPTSPAVTSPRASRTRRSSSTAAEELGRRPGRCFVTEDATSGMQAAKAAGMAGSAWPAWTTATCWLERAPTSW